MIFLWDERGRVGLDNSILRFGYFLVLVISVLRNRY